jgi:hypothetical protein
LNPKFEVGVKILVRAESARGSKSRKLQAPYIGPYEITRIEGPNLLFNLKFEVGAMY